MSVWYRIWYVTSNIFCWLVICKHLNSTIHWAGYNDMYVTVKFKIIEKRYHWSIHIFYLTQFIESFWYLFLVVLLAVCAQEKHRWCLFPFLVCWGLWSWSVREQGRLWSYPRQRLWWWDSDWYPNLLCSVSAWRLHPDWPLPHPYCYPYQPG